VPDTAAGNRSLGDASSQAPRGVPNFEYGGPDREALNRRTLMQTHKVEGQADINVNVNAPPGTRGEGKSAALFKPIAMTRQTQMAHTSQGPSGVAGGEFGGS
jgi:hypothetical protein